MSTPIDYRNDKALRALRETLTARADMAKAIHGEDSREYTAVAGVGFALADKLVGEHLSPERRAFLRWLFSVDA
jgi:hypothetical protein